MTIAALEEAIAKLVELVELPDQGEGYYQAWFETHPLVLQLLGYERVIPHPELRMVSGRVLVPDFMAERSGGIWEIIEIKRPDTLVLKNATRRQQFYRAFDSYVRQCREYTVFFEDEQNRRAVEAAFGTIIQHRVRARLIAGANAGLDRRRAHDLVSDVPLLDFDTYDDLLEQLERMRRELSGEKDETPGLSMHMFVQLPPSSDAALSWIIDVGEEIDRNRVSMFVRDHRLVTEIRDADGECHRLIVPLQADDSEPRYVGFQVGMESAFSVGRIWVGERSETTRWAPFTCVIEDPLPMVVGSNLLGDGESNIKVAEVAAFARMLTFPELLDLRHQMMDRSDTPWIVFECGAFMHTRGHPRFHRAIPIVVGGSTVSIAVPEVRERGLVQHDPSRQPRFEARKGQ